ncbi:hypothetical protein OC842_004898, partial [Tilletia horrida]
SILVLAHLLRRPCSCHGVRRDRPPSRAHMVSAAAGATPTAHAPTAAGAELVFLVRICTLQDRSTTAPTRVPGAAAPRASAPRAPGLTSGPSNPGPLADASGCLGPALGPEDKG